MMMVLPAQRRVAVVEDEETIREGICFALRREGYHPDPFDDGLAAWERLEQAPADLVILDIGLPRMDGLDLCACGRDPSGCRLSS
jgi:DNA-binding response OmpR family regulator